MRDGYSQQEETGCEGTGDSGRSCGTSGYPGLCVVRVQRRESSGKCGDVPHRDHVPPWEVDCIQGLLQEGKYAHTTYILWGLHGMVFQRGEERGASSTAARERGQGLVAP